MPQKKHFVQHRKRSSMFPNCDYHTHPQAHNLRPYTLDLLQPWIDRCRAKQIQSVAFTDHDRYVDGVDFNVINRLREKNPDVEILAGIELDNDPLTSAAGLRWVEKNWDQLDFVLGSVHYFHGETEMLDRTGDPSQIEARGASEAFNQYTRELEKLISRGFIDCLPTWIWSRFTAWFRKDMIRSLNSGRSLRSRTRADSRSKRARPVGGKRSVSSIRIRR